MLLQRCFLKVSCSMPSFCKVAITKATLPIHFSYKDFYKVEYCATVEKLILNTAKQNAKRNKKAKELIWLKKKKKIQVHKTIKQLASIFTQKSAITIMKLLNTLLKC